MKPSMKPRMKPKIVLANGVFDLLHYGHLLHLEAAKKLGDILIVSITQDDFVNKGPDRPIFTAYHRERVVKSLRCVDATMIVYSSLEALKLIRPDIFVKGNEYLGKILETDKIYCEENAIKIEYTYEQSYSSTELIRESRGRKRLYSPSHRRCYL